MQTTIEKIAHAPASAQNLVKRRRTNGRRTDGRTNALSFMTNRVGEIVFENLDVNKNRVKTVFQSSYTLVGIAPI